MLRKFLKRFAGPNIILNNFGFVCNFHIHWGKGGKGSEQGPGFHFFRNDNQKYRIEAIDQNTTKTVVEKLGGIAYPNQQ